MSETVRNETIRYRNEAFAIQHLIADCPPFTVIRELLKNAGKERGHSRLLDYENREYPLLLFVLPCLRLRSELSRQLGQRSQRTQRRVVEIPEPQAQFEAVRKQDRVPEL